MSSPDSRSEVVWLCSICGYHPGSSGRWCDAGCGSDFRQMMKVEGLPAIELREQGEKLTASDQRVKKLEDAREALALLVELKDGPRDDHYRAMKDRAWHRAREALSTLRGDSDD